MEFIQENWAAITAGVLVAAKIANKLTRHWPEWRPYLRWLGFLVEVLDVVEIRKPKIKKSDSGTKGQVDQRTARILEKLARYRAEAESNAKVPDDKG